MKDALLLDVDGVLNVPQAWPARSIGILMGDLTFFPAEFARDFMEHAWKNFDVFWLTSWLLSANFIARWANLPSAPVLHNRRSLKPGENWKAVAADEAFAGDARRVFWVEDGFTEDAIRWAEERGNVFLIETDPNIGVTEDTLRLL